MRTNTRKLKLSSHCCAYVNPLIFIDFKGTSHGGICQLLLRIRLH